ncbi:MAG: hypothetical protein U5Q03_08470 [Bacteroidota bacterium]|nr:hypothetical protein [Bacteroidota bacterium]
MSTGLLNLSGKPKKKLRNYIEERKKIPVNHLEFATDNIKEMTSIKIEKILKAILRGSH